MLEILRQGRQFKFLWRFLLSFRVIFFFFFKATWKIFCDNIIVDELDFEMLSNHRLCGTLWITHWICTSVIRVCKFLTCWHMFLRKLWFSWVMFAYFHKVIEDGRVYLSTFIRNFLVARLSMLLVFGLRPNNQDSG